MQIYSIVDLGESDFISDLNFNNNKQQQCKLWKQLERFITHKETWRQKNMLASSMEIIHDIHTLCMVCFPSPPPPRYTKKNPPIGDCIISSFIIKHKTYTIYYYLWNTEIHKTFPLLLLLSCLKYNIRVITIFNNNAGLLDCCKDVLNYMFSLWIIRYTERNNNKVWNRLLKLKKI